VVRVVCALVWFRLGILVFILISVSYQTVCLLIVFGHIRDGMWELGGGKAVCFQLISLFPSVCWLEKLMLSLGAFVC